jgi:glucosylceramidase
MTLKDWITVPLVTAALPLSILATIRVETPQPARTVGEAVSVVVTTPDLALRLSPQPTIAFSSGPGTQDIVVALNQGRTYQTMVGFGASFTDSSAWLLYDQVDANTRQQVLRDLFTRDGPEGIGLTLLRQPASATDYIKDVGGYYTFDDMPQGSTDPSLDYFSIDHDRQYIIPVLLEALAVNPDLRIQLSMWTAPAWMKTNGSLIHGGSLIAQYRPHYAALLVKAIQAYEAAGVPIWATSVINEPTVSDRPYPQTFISAADSASIIRDHLSPTLREVGLTTRILGGDDVAFDAAYPAAIIDSDPVAGAEIPATASHGYWGDFTDLSRLHEYYPNKDVYQTELAPGCAYSPIDLFMRTVRNFASTNITWNIALDPDGGPFHSDTEPHTCTPLVTVNPDGTVDYTINFYQQGQIARFVQPGAVRFFGNDTPDVPTLAFRNPDGSDVLVAWNKASTARTFSVNWGDQHFDYTLTAGAVATFTWNGEPEGDPSGWGDSTFGTNASTGYAGGTVRGEWQISTAESLVQTSLGPDEWPSIYYGYADHRDLTVSARITGIQAGESADYPKYGIYACYRSSSDYVQAWIDPTSSNYVTHVVSGGQDEGWHDTALPSQFDPEIPHEVTVTRTGDQFVFYLDGKAVETRTATIQGTCQMGLVAEDYVAKFEDVHLGDPLLWGNAANATPGADDDGMLRGDWAIAGPDSASVDATGANWASAYRGYARETAVASVVVEEVRPGLGVAERRYGVYAAYSDADNYIQGWISPFLGVFEITGRVGGLQVPAQAISLPANFDQGQPHTLSVRRTGDLFEFALDGVAVGTLRAAAPAGQFGLVVQDYAVRFRQVTLDTDPSLAAPVDGARYHLYNVKSLRQLGVKYGSTADGSTADIYDPVQEADQVWILEQAGVGNWLIRNAKSETPLAPENGATADDTPVVISDSVPTVSQIWSLTRDASGYFTITNEVSNRVLSVLDSGTENEDAVVIHEGGARSDQLWVLAPVR